MLKQPWKFKHGILVKELLSGRIRMYYVYARNKLNALFNFIKRYGDYYFIYKIKGYELKENND